MRADVVTPAETYVSFEDLMEFVRRFRRDALKIADQEWLIDTGTAIMFTDFETYVDIELKSIDDEPEKGVPWYVHITRGD